MRLISLFILFIISSNAISQQTLNKTLSHDGLTREYILYIPAIYDGSISVPLILNLHGYTSNNQDQMDYGDFRPIADTANFIIALPQGTIDSQGQTFWNARYGEQVDDLGFIDVLIDSIASDFNINQDKVYSTGISNGGVMSYMLACELSNRITAIGPVAGAMITSQLNFCTPNRPIPVIHIHGTMDAVVNYNGTIGILSVDSALNYWIDKNNCSTSPVVTSVSDIVTSDFCTATRYEYTNGNFGSEVVHYKITGGGHSWPGSTIFTGQTTNQDINASVEIWKFFNKYEMSDLVSVSEYHPQNNRVQITSSNLADNTLSISTTTEQLYNYSIYDLQGKKLISKNNVSGSQTLSVAFLPSGFYILNAQVGNSVYAYKFIKN